MALQYHKMVILFICNPIANEKSYLCAVKNRRLYESRRYSIDDSVPGHGPGIGLRVLYEAGHARAAAEGAAGLRLRRYGGGIGMVADQL